jgi:cytoskeletal protein CcmA (bactofilin family)
MFKRKPKGDVLAEIETLIGAGTRIEGDVAVTGGVHIEGFVRGNVTTSPGATAVLSIAEQGVVEGTVDVPRVVVHGEVKGDIRATDKVELGATARISGNVAYGIIEMAAGAVIQGRLMAAAGAGAPAAPEANVAATAAPGANVGPRAGSNP